MIRVQKIFKLHAWLLEKPWRFILALFVIWRVSLELIAEIAKELLPVREQFLGPNTWANFDGVHYISIAINGYGLYEHAFFPLYPLLIRWLSHLFGGNYILTGLTISNVSFIGVLFLLWKITEKVVPKKKHKQVATWTLLFAAFFPTSFYFGSVYTESLFLLFILCSFYVLLLNNKILYGLFASLASATRFVGVLLGVPIGLLFYMVSLYRTNNDPFYFIHVQPEFGANRTAGELILLPQVIWRYAKIFYTVPVQNYDFWIALLEFTALIAVLVLLYVGWKKKLPSVWIYFSLASVIAPTLTGTLSSVPRYVLVAFPVFIVLAQFSNKYRFVCLIINVALFIILTMLFVQGYWVA